MRHLLLFGVWSCVSVCSQLVDTPTPDSGEDCGADCPDDGTLPGPGIPTRAIILVMDGARFDETFSDGYSDASEQESELLFTYFKENLLPKGTLIRPGYASGITITAPGHADILTGTRNLFAHFPTDAGVGYYRPEYPTLFEAAAVKWPGNVGSLVANSEHLQPLTRSLYPDATDQTGAAFTMVYTAGSEEEPSDQDTDVLAELKIQILANDSRISLANLHQMDRAGHYSENVLAYGQSVEIVSQPISAFWDWIQSEESLRDTTMLVVLADHGRHRWGPEADERGAELRFDWDYSEHGDQCGGCREIPMFLMGPGIQSGLILETPYTLEDIGATVGHALGLSMPYATGTVIEEAFMDDAAVVSRSGTAAFDLASGHDAQSVWLPDPSIRAGVYVDGVRLSSPNTANILAEDPVLYSTASDALVACWRELDLQGEANPIDMPWTPQCQVDTGTGFGDIVFPATKVFPLWRPAIAETADGTLLFAFADNENSNAYSTSRGGIGLYRWSAGGGWVADQEQRWPGLFVGNPSIAILGGQIFVANAESDMGMNGPSETSLPGRYTRHISVKSVSGSANLNWTEVWRTYTEECPTGARCPEIEPTLDNNGDAWGRTEFPVLTTLGPGLAAAWISWGTGGVAIHSSVSDATGTVWSTPARQDDTGRVLGHVEPAWGGSWLYWAQLTSSGDVEVCRWSADSARVCVATGFAAVRDLTVDGADVNVLGIDDTGLATQVPLVW